MVHAVTSQELLVITGSIDTNRGDVEGYNGFKNALLSAKQHNLEHEVLTGDQVNARFTGYNLPSNFMVCFLPDCDAAAIMQSVRHIREISCVTLHAITVRTCSFCIELCISATVLAMS